MSEESVESIFQHACEGAAESIGSTRTDWRRVVDAIRFLRRERDELKQWGADLSNELTHRTTKLTEARRLLDDALADLDSMQQCFEDARREWIKCADELQAIHDQQPVAWMNGDRAKTNEQIQDVADYGYLLKQNGWTPLYAAPVPAQPAAVPEAVAKDAAAILVQALEEIAWQRPLGVRPSKSGEAMERAAIIALHKYNALLSAADTEVKK